MKPWSQWVQENTGTLFCLGSFFGLLIFTVHVEHHGDHDSDELGDESRLWCVHRFP